MGTIVSVVPLMYHTGRLERRLPMSSRTIRKLRTATVLKTKVVCKTVIMTPSTFLTVHIVSILSRYAALCNMLPFKPLFLLLRLRSL